MEEHLGKNCAYKEKHFTTKLDSWQKKSFETLNTP